MECAPKECGRLCCSAMQNQHEITDELQTGENDWPDLLLFGACPVVTKHHRDMTLHNSCKMDKTDRVLVTGK